MENNPKENINQFKKEFKHFIKNTIGNVKKDKTKTENKTENEKEKKQETNVVNEGIDIMKIIVGGFIIIIGIIFLLANFNVIEIDINIFLRSLFKLWPVLIILAGISVLNKKHITSGLISILFILIILLTIMRIFFAYDTVSIKRIDSNNFKVEIPDNIQYQQSW